MDVSVIASFLILVAYHHLLFRRPGIAPSKIFAVFRMESGDTWASAPGLYDTAGAFYPITMAEELTTPQFSSGQQYQFSTAQPHAHFFTGPQFSGPQFLTVPQYAHLPITLYLPPQFSPLLTHAESESYDQTDQMPSLTPFGSPLESLSPELQYDIMGLESINTSTAPRGELIPTEVSFVVDCF